MSASGLESQQNVISGLDRGFFSERLVVLAVRPPRLGRAISQSQLIIDVNYIYKIAMSALGFGIINNNINFGIIDNQIDM